jgi:hypothetical protein
MAKHGDQTSSPWKRSIGMTLPGVVPTVTFPPIAVKASGHAGWPRTQEGYHIRRDAIVALVSGEK